MKHFFKIMLILGLASQAWADVEQPNVVFFSSG